MKSDASAKVNSCKDETTVLTPSYTHLLFMACLCLGEGKTRGQKKAHVVKHKNKRWRIKTADGGKGKDYQEEDVNGYTF